MSSPIIQSSSNTSTAAIPPSPLTSALQSSSTMDSLNHCDDEENDKRVTVDEHFDIEAHHQNTDNNNDDNEGKSSTSASSSSIDESKGNSSTTKNEIQIRSDFSDVRIAVIGNVDAGKSSLIGVLTSGALDDGRGLARSKIFIHHHESTTGRTSCISHHILGFTEKHEPVHQTAPASASAAQKSKSWHAVVTNSKNIVTFVDLCGHEKYLKTTIAGLTGSFPDFAMVLVNSLAGITKMTREHLGISIALEIPLIIVVTKIDLAPPNVLESTKAQLDKILKSNAAKKMPVTIRNNGDIDLCVENQSGTRIAPIFYISSVEGTGLNLLYSYISRLKPRFNWIKDLGKPSEFDIDETFQVAGVGIVVSGTVKAGVIKSGDEMLLGPISSENGSEWMPVLVRSVHCKRVPVEHVNAGNSCALSIRSIRRKDAVKRQTIRRGMVLVDGKTTPKATRFFEAEILVLNHPTTVKLGYQAVIHCGIIRQTASMIHIDKEFLRSGDRATVRFKFIQHEEFLHTDTVFVFREGSTKGLGKVTKTSFTEKEIETMEADDIQQKQKQKQKHQENVAAVLLSEAEADAARIAAPSSAEEVALEEKLRAAVGQIIQPTNSMTGVIDDKRLKQKFISTKKHHDEEHKAKKVNDNEATVDKGGTGKKNVRHDQSNAKKETAKDSESSSSSAAAKGKKSKR